MTARDRLIVTIIGALAIVGVAYLLVVSPERKQAASVSTEMNAASARLQGAEAKLAEARQAQARYSAAYASIVSLGKAVPTSEEVPALIYQLAQVTHQKKVDFSSIVSGPGASSGTAAASASATTAAGSATATATSAGFTQMPFTFVFNGTYADLERLFAAIDHNVVQGSSGTISVNGRLLTIQSVKLGPLPQAGQGQPSNELTGTIAATAYVLPAGQGLTAGATSQGPAGVATPSSSSSSGGSAAAAAVVKVAP